MKTSSFTKRQIIPYLLLISVLLSPGCSKEDDQDPPTKGTNVTKTSKAIGSSGGTLKIDSFFISIPPGAFSMEHTLEISVSDKQHPFLEQEITDLFSVKGIPEEFQEPLVFVLKYDGILKEESYLAFGEEYALEETDSSLIFFDLMSCTDSSGYLVGTLLPPGQTTSAKKGEGALNSRKGEIPEDLVSFVKGVTDFKTKSPSSRFIIKHPAYMALNPRILSLPEYLELNYLILRSFIEQEGFGSYAIIPEKVNVYDNRKKSNSDGKLPCFQFGTHKDYVPPGIQKNQYFDYRMYKDPLEEKELNLRIGLAFFKSFQRYVFFNEDSRDWFSLASMLWIEEEFCEPWENVDNYVPAHLAGNELACFTGWDSRSYYGMVPAVKYLVDTYGERVVFTYHYHIWQRRSSFEALELATGVDQKKWFSEFLKAYLEGHVYGVGGSIFANGVPAKHQHDLPALNAPQSYPEQYDDLAARMFLFSTDNISNNTMGLYCSLESLDVDATRTDILLFSIDRGSHKIEFIKNSMSNRVELFDLKDLSDQNKDLLVLVVNSQYESFTNDGYITLKVELKESMPLAQKKFSIDLNHFTGDVHYRDGTVKTFNDIHMRMYMPDAVDGKVNGNRFEAKWDNISLGVFTTDSGHVWANLLIVDGKLNLNGFYFHKVTENTDSNNKYSYRLLGGNMPLFLVEGTEILAGRVEGIDVKNKIASFQWKVTNYDEDQSILDGSYTIKNIQFRPESYLEVYLYEPD